MTNLGLDVSQLLKNTTMCSKEMLTALSDMSFAPVPAHPTLSTYPLHTPAGLYHMQKGEWTRGEQKPNLAPLTCNFVTSVRSPLRPGPWSKHTLYHWVSGPHFTQDSLSMDTHVSSLAPPLALRPELSASSYDSKSGEQAGECNSLLIYWRLGLLCPIMPPPAIRRQSEEQLCEETAVKNVTLDPRVYRPPHCVLSLLMGDRRQQQAWLKVWEEQAGKQELLAAVFPRPFMWSAEKSPVNMDDGCFCASEWLWLSFRIYYRCCFHGQHQRGFY